MVLVFEWYSYNQHQIEQQAKVVQLEEDSKSDKEQVDETFKQEKLDIIVNFLTDITEKFQKQMYVLKKEA